MKTPHFDESFVTQLKDRASLAQIVGEAIELRSRGNDLVGLCPFHAEKTPSFHVHADRGFFKCFGCGVGGDVVRFVELWRRLTFPEAIEWLADRYGLSYRDDRPRGVTKREAGFSSAALRETLLKEAAAARRSRGISDDEILLTSELNAIRERVGHRHGIVLPGLVPSLSEGGGYAGRDRDPLWHAVFAWRWDLAWKRRGVIPPPCDRSLLDDAHVRLVREVLVEVEDAAAQEMRFAVRGVRRRHGSAA
jgi:hypothetical protein